MLDRYFTSRGDYAAHLERSGRRTEGNAALRAAFGGTSFVQEAGMRAGDPGAGDRDLVCRLYDERRSVAERLGVASEIMARGDVLTFLPTMEVFLRRHPPDRFAGDEATLFATMRDRSAARDQVLRLARELEVSALKVEVAHFARHMGWMSARELERMAIEGARSLLARPLTSEIVDIECEIAKHAPIGQAITSNDLPEPLFAVAEGVRLVDCLGSTDGRVSGRLAAALDHPDASVRLWALYALSRRLPLDESIVLRLQGRLDDESTEMRERMRWIVATQEKVRRACGPRCARKRADRARGVTSTGTTEPSPVPIVSRPAADVWCAPWHISPSSAQGPGGLRSPRTWRDSDTRSSCGRTSPRSLGRSIPNTRTRRSCQASRCRSRSTPRPTPRRRSRRRTS